MIDTNPLLLNILIILLSIFVAQFALYSKPAFRGTTLKIWFAAGASACVILTMLFPFTLSPGNIYDLRKIPFLIAIFYGGRRIGFAVFALMIIYRFSLGGFGAWSTLIVYSVLYITAQSLKPLYDRSSNFSKIAIASILAGLSSSVGPFFDWLQDPVNYEWHNLAFYGYYFLLHMIVMSVAILLIENIKSYLLMRDEALRIEKIDVSNQLAAAVAHEVRNPLTVSRGFMQLLLGVGEIHNETQARYVQTAIDEIDHAEAVISRFLSYSRSEEINIQPVAVADYLETHQDLFLSLSNKRNCRLEIKAEPEICMLTDIKTLAQILVNVVKNAAESMPNGGNIQITAKRIREKVEIKVADEGMGMTNEQLKQLGTPFYSTKASGTGLGMMTSYNLIRSMNGRIMIHSQLKKGTSVTIILPSACKQD